MCFATIDVEGAENSRAVCAALEVPCGLPVPWMAAIWGGRRIAIDASIGSAWRCQHGLLLGADICKHPGSLALLCERLLEVQGLLE